MDSEPATTPKAKAKRFHVLLNARSGSVQTAGVNGPMLEERFRAAGLEAAIEADDEHPLEERVARAAASGAEIVVAAGGDGTVTALSGALAGADKTLAILPLGTANLMARDLAIPLDLDEWIAALPAMRERPVDLGTVNGRVFLHKVVIGLVPGIAAGREVIRQRPGLMSRLAFLRFFFRRLFRSRRLAVEIATDEGERRIARVRSLAVANNAYGEGFARFFSRPRLDGGRLTLYLLRRLTLADMLRLIAAMLFGRWRQDEALDIESVKAVTIRSRRPALNVMIDGEVAKLDTPLEFQIRPGALRVLAPVAEDRQA